MRRKPGRKSILTWHSRTDTEFFFFRFSTHAVFMFYMHSLRHSCVQCELHWYAANVNCTVYEGLIDIYFFSGKYYNYTTLNCTSIIVPNYGQLNCYFAKQAQGPYLYYPMGVILVVNLMLFIMTVVTVYNYRRDTQAILLGASTNQTQA